MVTLRVTVLVVICSRGQPCIGCQPGGGLGLEDALQGAAPGWSEEQEDEEAGASSGQKTPEAIESGLVTLVGVFRAGGWDGSEIRRVPHVPGVEGFPAAGDGR